MMPSILSWVDDTRRRLAIAAGHVLEVGSLDVNGSARAGFRDAASYTGVDLKAGPGVDVVLDALDLTPWRKGILYDTVVCCETLEHVVRPWLVVDQLKAALKPGGHLWVSTPGYRFPVHRFPVDCFRFGEDAYRLWLFAEFDLLGITQCYDENNNFSIAAVGRSIAKQS